MVQLISKGGFRERANRSRKYQHSENQQTVLHPTQYRSEQEQNQHSPDNINKDLDPRCSDSYDVQPNK